MAVVLIALLVLLSVVHARVRARAEREEDERDAERERLLAELASLLTRLQMLLVPHRSASPKQFTSELTKAAGEMRSLAAEADKNHKALVQATGAMTGATTSLRDAAGKLTAEVPKLGAAADRIETALREGQRAATQAGTASTHAARLIADQVKTSGATVDTSLRALVAAQTELVAKTEAVARTTDQACKALVSSTSRTNDAVEGMREATERWDAAAAHWQDAAARVETGVRSFAGAPSRNGAESPRSGGGLYGSGYGYAAPGGPGYGATVPMTPRPEGNGTPVPAAHPPANGGQDLTPPPTRPGPTPAPEAPKADTPGAPPEPDVQDDPSLSGGTPRDATGSDSYADAPHSDSDLYSARTRALRPPLRRPPSSPGGDT
ncbi:hypothetical protein RB200_03765 [Streptomyces sp. PmtG]